MHDDIDKVMEYHSIKDEIEKCLLKSMDSTQKTYGCRESEEMLMGIAEIDQPLLKLYLIDTNPTRKEKLWSLILNILILYDQDYIKLDEIREKDQYESIRRMEQRILDLEQNVIVKKDIKKKES